MMRSRDNEAQMDELGNDPAQVGPDGGGQSGDTQRLSEIADAADDGVEELADTGQDYEAEVIDGVDVSEKTRPGGARIPAGPGV
jgi:hypothetical protein